MEEVLSEEEIEAFETGRLVRTEKDSSHYCIWPLRYREESSPRPEAFLLWTD